MTEQVPPMDLDERDTEDAPHEADPLGPMATGVRAVDEVIADVGRLDDAPLEEHLEVFERAHESLRTALDAQPESRPSDDPGDPA